MFGIGGIELLRILCHLYGCVESFIGFSALLLIPRFGAREIALSGIHTVVH
jgi:hypothetical protein